ncbi:AbrB/MazE/SpoVT family DNA-binding domain-containing protein [Botrimarina mediterranea]|uniref:SpoVT-AbrB domain-containing protein n=1 Tax=Botrimarina mediterranea TaxID=2528022 RepID=A0A518K3A5_9BACT|nr:AbrB/MazE/SpoVT family DNA-binding domain-containing protein [Botrimarina mediterranea]QDV72267.1 hypothetical protein Spa11_04410 [Botrimarina mediterranea]QDV76811.1 hypothetical protein K2D_03940 [Planctomycetes bacterium K2D]
MMVLEVTIIEGNPALVLPTELADRLGLVEGSQVEIDDANFRPIAEHERQMQVARSIMREDSEALRDLAK